MEFLIASLYKYIYIIIIGILTLLYLPKYVYIKTYETGNSLVNKDNAYILLIAVILFIGFRPVVEVYFNDMAAYDYILRRYSEDIFTFDWDTDNKLFDNFILWYASSGLRRSYFFLVMATLYFGAMYLGLKRLFPDSTKLAFLTYLAGFSTFTYAVNGVKAGVAASIFILALSFRNKKIIFALLLAISMGFHHSMVMPITACIISFFVKNPRIYYWIWGFCLLMCILHITYFQELFAGISDDQGAKYMTATSETTSAHIGFRPDFILYSAVPVIMGYYFEIRNKYILSRKTHFLIHFYILSNAVWMLCMYASFNNRIAYLSWFVYPIVIIAPFLDKMNKDPLRYLKLDKVVKYHLYFTMFMLLIYYGLFSLGR